MSLIPDLCQSEFFSLQSIWSHCALPPEQWSLSLWISVHNRRASLFTQPWNLLMCADMRKAIEDLAAIVQHNFKLDVFSRSLFLFFGKRCDRIKAILLEEEFVLLKVQIRWKNYNQIKQQEVRAVSPFRETLAVYVKALKVFGMISFIIKPFYTN